MRARPYSTVVFSTDAPRVACVQDDDSRTRAPPSLFYTHRFFKGWTQLDVICECGHGINFDCILFAESELWAIRPPPRLRQRSYYLLHSLESALVSLRRAQIPGSRGLHGCQAFPEETRARVSLLVDSRPVRSLATSSPETILY